MIACRLAALWLGLIAPAVAPEGRGAVVVVDAPEVLDEPDDSAYASGELRRGDRVTVVSALRGDWLTIAPPPESFRWADAAALRDRGDGTAEVIADRAPVRSGADGARLPGPPRPPLARGAIVRLVDRPNLETKSRIWRAIGPAEGEVRYVKAVGFRLDPMPVPIAERRTSMDDRDLAIPPDVAAELASIDALRRSIRAGPVEQWDLEPARRRYEALLGRMGESSPGSAVVRGRIDRVSDDAELAGAARRFDDLVRAGRRRDAEVADARQALADARAGTERNYDARGMLQASSRQVDGQKVHALIGPEGRPIAYLAIPPGIPTARLLARKVGVRGEVHFDEGLGARLITVRDLDALDRPR